jgi:cellulose synthase/poly-beta-1,6-N-acetylglucosamine synthase-like glycosyltransferase
MSFKLKKNDQSYIASSASVATAARMVADRKEFHAYVQSRKVFNLSDYLLFALLTIVSCAIIAYFMTHWFDYGDWFAHPLPFWGLTLMLIVRLTINQFRWWYLPFMRKPVPMTPHLGWRVGVATTFVPGNEPIEMLEETIRALVALNYPHDTWVLDEGNDTRVISLCTELGAFHFSRKNFPQYQTEDGTFRARSKHGNYNAWLHEVGFERYEIIAAFDPDHVPEPSFLSEVLGYFNDPQVGYVQAAQAYYNQEASFIARGAAEETYGYYSSTQMFSFAMGYPVVTGCHNTHRVAALRQVRGLPAHDADDLLITLLYRVHGWRGVYVPRILARGLTPVDWSGYIRQQLRWARSVIDIKLRKYPEIGRKLPIKERLAAFAHGLYYLQGITVGVGVVIMAYMLATGLAPRALNYLVLRDFALVSMILLLCDFYRQRFYLDWRNERGWHWRAGVLQLAKWPYFLVALFQVLSNRRFPYVVTNKLGGQPQTYVLLGPHILVAALIATAWIVGIMSGIKLDPILHILAGSTLGGIFLLLATEHMNFPQPYDPSLSASVIARRLRLDERKQLSACSTGPSADFRSKGN